MLCAACLSIFASPFPDAWHEGPHHESRENLEKAAKNGCYLCSELFEEYVESESYSWTDVKSSASSVDGNFHTQRRLEKRGAFTTFHLRIVTAEYGDLYYWFEESQSSSATFFLVRNHALQRPPDYDQYLQAAHQDLIDAPWVVRDDGFDSPTNLLAESTGEPEVARVASKWLTRCLGQHSSCNSPPSSGESGWFPKRLLDVSDDKLRLILTEQTPPNERYATLSHCWGPDPICCLTDENLETWQSSIPLDELTQTFRDAVVTTQRMQIRYLWIDSLCILQAGPGSSEDWLEHAVAMRSVYRNSVLNIAVARASSGDEGAFVTRSPVLVRPCHVRWKPRLDHSAGEPEPFWTIRSILRHSSAAIRTLPLYTRAWVVQERFLAPRVLHFGDDRIMWECNEAQFIEESFPDGIPKYVGPDWKPDQWPFNLEGSSELSVAQPQETSDPIRELWHDMIDEFTRCDLSFPDKDIFIAFAGIAEVFGQHYDHRYVAGFFRQHLPFALWWQNKGVRSPTTRAPSWSWASIDGQVLTITPMGCPYCDDCCARLADVEDIRIDLVDGRNIYGQITAAELILRGQLIPCKIEKFHRRGTGLTQAIALFPGLDANDQLPARYTREATSRYRADDPDLVIGDSELDDEEESRRGSNYAAGTTFDRWALPLFRAKESKLGLRSEKCRYFGMVVKRNEDGKYVRVGLYSARITGEKLILRERGSLQEVCLV